MYGGIYTYAQNVVVNPLPDIPIISGINNNCNALTYTYTISNLNSSYTYDWTIQPTYGYFNNNPSVHNYTGTSVVITWVSPLSQAYDEVRVTVTDANSCSSASSFYYFDCCEPSGDYVLWNNTSVSALNGIYPPAGASNIIINGDFHIDMNFTFDKYTIALAPNSRIIINSGKTLNIKGGTLKSSVKCYNLCGMVYTLKMQQPY